jgi:hypothetical protein
MSIEQLSTNPYEDRPNREALESQREKYVSLAVEKLFSDKKKLDDLRYKYNEGGHDTNGEAIEYVYKELKEKHGINEKSSEKTVNEFYNEYPKEIIDEAISKKNTENKMKRGGAGSYWE